jgi:hypothetical protein
MLSKLVITVGIIVVSVLFYYVTPTDETHFFWEKFSIFNIFFGFFGCIVLIFVSKFLGHLFIQKKEDYYD